MLREIEEGSTRPVQRGFFRCGAHTLQLAVMDALKILSVQQTISKASLRNQTVMAFIREMKLQLPILENATRWSSTCNKHLSLVKLRNFCDSMGAAEEAVGVLTLTPNEWELVLKKN